MLAGRAFWLRPLAIEDYALLIAWLDDVIPGRADRVLAPKFTSEESMAALDSPIGRAVTCYAVLRHHGVTWDESVTISASASEQEWIRLYDVLFTRRRYARPGDGPGKDIAQSWCGPVVMSLAQQYHQTMLPLGKLTFDQIDCMATEGAEDESPHDDAPGRPMSVGEVVEYLKSFADRNGD